jgi:hypothetical protein
MTDLITPPLELMEQWMQAHSTKYDLAREAAQWSADQELEACCEYVYERLNVHTLMELKLTTIACIAQELRAARRPRPPSLKEQALQELEQLKGDANSMGMGFDAPAIRRALEQLPDNQ